MNRERAAEIATNVRLRLAPDGYYMVVRERPHSMTDRELEEAFPWVDFKKPVPVTVGSRRSFECRYCIAHNGLKAEDAAQHRYSYEQTEEHIRREHS